MKRISFLLILILLAAFAVSACGPTTIVANPGPTQRTMVVNGTGTVNLTPDIAYINLGVHTDKPTRRSRRPIRWIIRSMLPFVS